jgi:branched-subunit amino acid transport protein
MTVALAVLAVGLGSILFRTVPLLAARRLPDKLATHAEHAGLAVIAALVVRAVVLHRDPGLTGTHHIVPLAPLVALVATAVALVVAYRGRSLLVAVTVGGATYVAMAAVLGATT